MLILILLTALTGSGAMHLNDIQMHLQALQFKCKPGSDVPESIRPVPEPHQLYCWRRRPSGEEMSVQIFADDEDHLTSAQVTIVPGGKMFTPATVAPWFSDLVGALMEDDIKKEAEDWTHATVLANQHLSTV